MLDTISKVIETCSNFLWGWPMIIMLLGTHLFLTIRLKFPQRKIFTAIRLSVTPDKGASGDVSQFGALATALAATIGTGNITRCCHCDNSRRSGSCAVVLAHGSIRHCNEVCRGTCCREIPYKDSKRADARRSDVCP